MAYTPTTWVTGDTITAVKLNNMEQGIANAGMLLVNIERLQDETNFGLDKTWQEIHDATLSGGVAFIQQEAGEGYNAISRSSEVRINYFSEVGYVVAVADIEYLATTANDYPRTYYEV